MDVSTLRNCFFLCVNSGVSLLILCSLYVYANVNT